MKSRLKSGFGASSLGNAGGYAVVSLSKHGKLLHGEQVMGNIRKPEKVINMLLCISICSLATAVPLPRVWKASHCAVGMQWLVSACEILSELPTMEDHNKSRHGKGKDNWMKEGWWDKNST